MHQIYFVVEVVGAKRRTVLATPEIASARRLANSLNKIVEEIRSDLCH